MQTLFAVLKSWRAKTSPSKTLVHGARQDFSTARGARSLRSRLSHLVVRTPRGARSTTRDDTGSSRETWNQSGRRPALEIPQENSQPRVVAGYAETSCRRWCAKTPQKTTFFFAPLSTKCSGGGNGAARAPGCDTYVYAIHVPPRLMTSEAPTVRLCCTLHPASKSSPDDHESTPPLPWDLHCDTTWAKIRLPTNLPGNTANSDDPITVIARSINCVPPNESRNGAHARRRRERRNCNCNCPATEPLSNASVSHVRVLPRRRAIPLAIAVRRLHIE